MENKGESMSKTLAVLGVVLGLVLLLGLYWMSCVRSEVQLRNQISAQQDVNKASHDTMWKILQDKAGVTSEYKNAFADIYPKLMSGRYADRQKLLFQFVNESNPKFDTSLYKDLMASIESERKTFLREQKKLRDLKQAHDNLLDQPPSSWFLAGRSKIDVIIVTSTHSEEVFESGRDDGTLFPKR
jgi:hypothetical protein